MSALNPSVNGALPGLHRIPVGRLLLPTLAIALLACALFALCTGAYSLGAKQVVVLLLAKLGLVQTDAVSMQDNAVLFSLRLPRVVFGILVGAGLGACGAALQGLFRNPLADPTLIGVMSGAGLAAATVIVLGAVWIHGLSRILGPFTLPLAAFLGGLAATTLVYRVATSEGRSPVALMLLAGIAVNAIAEAGIGLFTYLADDQQLRNLSAWRLGSVAGPGWRELSVVAPVVVLSVAALMRMAKPLNALVLGEAPAGHLGVDVQSLKRRVIVLTALCTGAVTAYCGMIFFVGLMAPHMVRLVCGSDNRLVLPGGALLGALLIVVADTVARTLVAPAELPIGVLTALLGAPFFIALLLRNRREWGM